MNWPPILNQLSKQEQIWHFPKEKKINNKTKSQLLDIILLCNMQQLHKYKSQHLIFLGGNSLPPRIAHSPIHHLGTMLRQSVFNINRSIRTHTYCQLPKVTEPELKSFWTSIIYNINLLFNSHMQRKSNSNSLWIFYSATEQNAEKCGLREMSPKRIFPGCLNILLKYWNRTRKLPLQKALQQRYVVH